MKTTAVGSYPKLGTDPKGPNLRRTIAQLDRGEITREQLRQVEDKATNEVVREQVDAGIDLITDGQIRWDDGQTYFARRIGGFQITGLIRYFDTNTYFRQPVAKSKLEWQGPISVEDYLFAAKYSTKPVKAVITGPYTLGRLSQLGVYKDLASLVMDLASILNQEALALQKAGATFIQFDEPAIVKNKHDISLLQKAAGVVTKGLNVTTEIRTWFGDVSKIHKEFFQPPFSVIGLDFVAGPANYDLLKDFPKNNSLDAGILDARNTKLETLEQIGQAIKRITQYVSPDRLYVSPSAGLEYLPRTNALAKLVRLVEGVRGAREAVHA